MIKGNTKNFFVTDLDYMEDHPNKRANAVGRKVTYHLQYVRDGNVNIKPEVKKDDKQCGAGETGAKKNPGNDYPIRRAPRVSAVISGNWEGCRIKEHQQRACAHYQDVTLRHAGNRRRYVRGTESNTGPGI